MKYSPTQSAIAHNPFRTALRAGKNIQRPPKPAKAGCTYPSHSRNDTARPLTTTLAPTTERGLISACSMQTIKSQKCTPKAYGACASLMDKWQALLAPGEPGEIEVRRRRFDGRLRHGQVLRLRFRLPDRDGGPRPALRGVLGDLA